MSIIYLQKSIDLSTCEHKYSEAKRRGKEKNMSGTTDIFILLRLQTEDIK